MYSDYGLSIFLRQDFQHDFPGSLVGGTLVGSLGTVHFPIDLEAAKMAHDNGDLLDRQRGGGGLEGPSPRGSRVASYDQHQY